MTDVANLRGVERDGDRVFLVWDYVDGVPFDAYAAGSDDPIALARELVHTVEHFHSTGLVHGAIHAGNVLVDNGKRIRLIDVSPLLFLDPLRDERAVVDLCGKVAALTGIAGAAIGDVSPMQALSAELSVLKLPTPAVPRTRIRRRTLLAALGVILIGVGLAITVHRLVERNQPFVPTPPRLVK